MIFRITIFIVPIFAMLFTANAQTVVKQYVCSGNVNSFVENNGKLYVATDAGTIDVIKLGTGTVLQQIKLPAIVDFMGDEVKPNVFSIDYLPENGAILFSSQGQAGFSNLFMYVNGKLVKLLDWKADKQAIIRAVWLNAETVLLGTLGDELIHYSVKERKLTKKVQVWTSPFSDFAIDNGLVVVADESGVLRTYKTSDLSLAKESKGLSYDKLYDVDFANGTLVAGGHDRRLAVYKASTEYSIITDFPVYAVALSVNGKLAAYQANENADVVVFNTNTKQELTKITGKRTMTTKMLFLDENNLLISSFSKKIIQYRF